MKKSPIKRTPTKQPTSWWVVFGAMWLSLGLGAALLTEVRTGPFVAAVSALGLYVLLTVIVPRQWHKRQSRLPELAVEKEIVLDDPRQALLVEANQQTQMIHQAINQVPFGLRRTLHALVRHSLVIIDATANAPEKLNHVLRFFTYYLPATANLVSDRLKLEVHAGQARLSEIDNTLVRLEAAFANFEHVVLTPDLDSVDMDMALLDKALKDELESR
ncbi:5-bromo-4-chloroindolyl phosphate hydrolysis family protein [Candidatus Phycosocius spiralis]|uniref:5-bromo-4-chloroindolyl phosphate hydrolase n=1 Tax=Candidatus Phycosocius spiralis TaxID=2815099 RepID=A0ABQ4PXT8_9PROT|nr:5-bromo-4-chloroindolyl phosphate hydrolysis family protein [Candidatus Phycosocius spiralis]GIU67827.1 hypothetical protein PsB1_1981 [Candidatus Phycosocius spiralis]